MHHFKVGDSASVTKTISEADITAFAQISGDHNPLHLDAEFAASSSPRCTRLESNLKRDRQSTAWSGQHLPQLEPEISSANFY
jgi:hypothetical protein